MPKHPLISIPLDIPDVRVLQTELTKDGELMLTLCWFVLKSLIPNRLCDHR